MPRILDLSVKLEDRMPAHKGLHNPFVLPHLTHEKSKALALGTKEDPLTFATSFFAMNDHIGTHVDAFFHTNPAGQTVDEMDLSMFMGRAVVLDLRHVAELAETEVADLEAAERKAGVTIDGHIVLLCWGIHARHYPDPKVSHVNPGISYAASHWLADRGSKLHGVEGPSTDRPTDPTFPNHRVCRDRRITHYEWLCNLEQLIGRGAFRFQGIPLNLGGGTGSPVRALAFLD
jgi:kynurenine formamidase